jgi:tetratricopeptide (TPR) repeat protein
MASSLRTLPGLALSLLFAGTLVAQTSQIEGQVKGEDGQPLKDALIKIERTDIKGNYKVKTRKKGDYLHAGLPLGQYNVILEVNGKDVDRVSGVRTRLGEPTVVNFDLEAAKQKQAAMQKAAETGQLTQEQARDMTPEQKAAIDKAMKERQAQLAKNKELNDAFNQGMEAIKTKQFDVAVTAFEKAGAMDPKQHVIWGQLAEAYSEMGKAKTGPDQEAALAKAIENYNKALELLPNDANYRNNLALVYARMKKFDLMEAELTKAVAADPANAGRYYFNLGAVLTNANQSEAACKAFKSAIDADRTTPTLTISTASA